MDSLKTCFGSLRRKAKTLLQHPEDRAAGECKRNKTKKPPSSSFDVLTSSFAAMEPSNQFKLVFKVIDANGDGKISSHELSQVLLCLGYDKSKATKEAERMVKQIDYNGDGFIDLDEFIDAVSDDGQLGSGNDEDYLMDAFLIFDADKNGLISAKELQKVLAGLGCNKCSLGECRRMIKGVDRDGDGFVDFQEFRSMMTAGNNYVN